MPGITEEPTGKPQTGDEMTQEPAESLSGKKTTQPRPDGKGSPRPLKVKPALRSRIDSLFSDLRSAADETSTLDETPPLAYPGIAPEQVRGPAAAGGSISPAQPEPDAFITAKPPARPQKPPRKRVLPALRPPEGGETGPLYGIAVSEDGAQNALSPLTPLGGEALATGDASFVNGVEAADIGFSQAFMAVPFDVQTAERETGRGLLEVLDENAARYWSEDERRLVEQVTDQLSLALENARLFQETQSALQEAQERRLETDALYRASAELNAAQGYQEILEILRRSTVLGHPAAAAVTMNVFASAPQAGEKPDAFATISRWSISEQITDGADVETSAVHQSPLSEAFSQLLRPNQHTMVVDVSAEGLAGLGSYHLSEQPRSLVMVPMTVAGQWIGHIIGAYQETVRFGNKEIRQLMALASQAAVTVQNLRLFEETRRRASQLETAAEIARDTSGTLALDVLLNRAVNLIRDRYGYYNASIFLLDESGQTAIVRESTGMAGEEMKRRGHRLAVGSRSTIGQVTATGQLMVLNDVTRDETFRVNPLLPDTRAELAIPFKVGTRIIGALDVQAIQTGAFTPDDVNVLSVLADQLAVAVDNARSYELAQQAISETAQRVDELSTVYDVSQSIAGASMQTQEIAQIISARFIHLLPIDLSQVYLIEIPKIEEERRVRPANAPRIELPPQPEYLRMLAAQTPRGPAPLPVEATLLTEYPFIDTILQAGGSARPLILQSIQPQAGARVVTTTVQGKRMESHTYLQSLGLRSLLLIPLAIKGQVIGIIELRSAAYVVDPDAAQMNLLMAIANSAAVALENARLYEEQIATAEKMRELDQLKSAFLANMSHELRTPLNSIIGFSRVILKGIDGPISELQQQDLTAIHNAGAHLLSLINDVLDISKIEAGKMELAFDDHVNITDLVNSAMSTAIGLTKDKPIRLERQIASDLPAVRADPTRIRQVLINFLSNAAKFTEEGTITVRAANSIGPDNRPEILVSVTDSGPGISKENQAKLFQAFSQVDNSLTRKVGGTGLGLSISRLLIDLHGGRIGVESEEGRGATFYFSIPVDWERPTTDEQFDGTAELMEPELVKDNTATLIQQPAPRATPRVLIIDDDRQVVNLYERYLEDQGYEVHALSDPAQALEKAISVRPDAITLDINMPKKDGWQVLETLKTDHRTRNIPVIICSIVAEAEKAFSLGATDYLSKPIGEDDLVHALQRLRGNGPPISDVLVIDDDPGTLNLVQKALTHDPSQITVRTALGGQQGLEALQQQPPDAVVLDLFMPDLDGFSLLETIRSMAATQDIPVLVFTAGDLTAEQTARIEEFSSQLIHKSAFEEKEFLHSIEGLLRRYKKSGD